MKNSDERFAFTPPPMVASDRAKKLEATMSVSDIPMEIPMEVQTCTSLLTRMADVVSEDESREELETINEVVDGAEYINDTLFAPPSGQIFVPNGSQAFLFSAPPSYSNDEESTVQIDMEAAQQSFDQELAQIYAAHMELLNAEKEAEQEALQKSEQEAQSQTSQNFTAPIGSFSEPTMEVIKPAVEESFDFEAEFQTHARLQTRAQEQAQTEVVAETEEEIITVVDYTALAKKPSAPKAKQTFSGLSSLSRHGGLAKAPVNQNVSNSWFA